MLVLKQNVCFENLTRQHYLVTTTLKVHYGHRTFINSNEAGIFQPFSGNGPVFYVMHCIAHMFMVWLAFFAILRVLTENMVNKQCSFLNNLLAASS